LPLRGKMLEARIVGKHLLLLVRRQVPEFLEKSGGVRMSVASAEEFQNLLLAFRGQTLKVWIIPQHLLLLLGRETLELLHKSSVRMWGVRVVWLDRRMSAASAKEVQNLLLAIGGQILKIRIIPQHLFLLLGRETLELLQKSSVRMRGGRVVWLNRRWDGLAGPWLLLAKREARPPKKHQKESDKVCEREQVP